MSQGNINSGLVLRKDRDFTDVAAQDITVHGSLGVESGRLKLAGQGFNVAVGYAPTTFATAVDTAVMVLNNRPNLPAVTTAASVGTESPATALILPAGAVITRAFVTNNGTTLVGGTDYNIGQSPGGTLVLAGTATSDTIFDAVVLANVNLGASVGGGQGTAESTMNFSDVGVALTDPGVTAPPGAVFASLGLGGLSAAASFVTVTLNGINTAGDLKVILEYLQLGSDGT